MARSRANGTPRPSSPLVVRLDEASKDILVRAAGLRRISVSDYVRRVSVAQTRREVEAAAGRTIALTLTSSSPSGPR